MSTSTETFTFTTSSDVIHSVQSDVDFTECGLEVSNDAGQFESGSTVTCDECEPAPHTTR